MPENKPVKKRVRPPTLNFYLGTKEELRERTAKIDALAEQIGARNRSKLLQMLADGEIKLTRTVGG